jgi:hypothetical protein
MGQLGVGQARIGLEFTQQRQVVAVQHGGWLLLDWLCDGTLGFP